MNDLAPLSVESSDSVYQVLKNDEVAARRAVLDANRQRTPSSAGVDAARRAAEVAAAEHASLTRRLLDLDKRIAEAEAPAPKSWRSLFKADASSPTNLEALRAERGALAMQQRAGEQRLLNTQSNVARTERQIQADVAAEGQRQRQAIVEAQSRLADIQQARRLVVLLPRLAYCRPPYVRGLGSRVRRAKAKWGNPNAVNIWGLPVDGPGSGQR